MGRFNSLISRIDSMMIAGLLEDGEISSAGGFCFTWKVFDDRLFYEIGSDDGLTCRRGVADSGIVILADEKEINGPSCQNL